MTKIRMIGLLLACCFLWGCATTGVPEAISAADNKVPDFTLPDQNEKPVTLSAVARNHRGVIVAFYPKDDTRN